MLSKKLKELQYELLQENLSGTYHHETASRLQMSIELIKYVEALEEAENYEYTSHGNGD